MKRDARLRSLSRDHHHALVLARYISAICARNGMDADLVALVRERFETELSPHFAIEETLLDALEGCGVDHLVRRTRDEHAEMRRLVDATIATDPTCLCELGELLTRHVRFEERELYPALEAHLSSSILDGIANTYGGA